MNFKKIADTSFKYMEVWNWKYFFVIVIEPDIAELLAEDLNVDIRKVLSLCRR